MLRLFTLILASTVLVSTCFSQQTKKPELTGNIVKDVNNLLPRGNITADIMIGIKQSKRQAELMEKFKAGITKNHKWFVDYTYKYEKVKPVPYHSNFGLTEDEYNEMQEGFKAMEIKSSGRAVATIIKNNNIISFKAAGRLEILEAIMFDLKKNIVIMGDNILKFTTKSNITDEDNGLKSKWKGYNWEFSEPKNLGPKGFKDLKNLNFKFFKLTIGRLEKNGKTLLHFQGRQFINGKPEVEFDIPLVF